MLNVTVAKTESAQSLPNLDMLYEACRMPLTKSTVLRYLDVVSAIPVSAYIRERLPDELGGYLPATFRMCITAMDRISPDQVDAFLQSWKASLTNPVVGLQQPLIDFLYMIIYVMVFIQFYAMNEYSSLYYKIYAQLLAMFKSDTYA